MDLNALTDQFFTLSAAGDAAGLAAMCSEDARIKQNIADEGDVDSLVNTIEGMKALGLTVRYSDVRRVIADTAVTEEHRATITRTDGVEASSDICVVLRFDEDGLITRLDEYVDGAAFASVFA